MNSMGLIQDVMLVMWLMHVADLSLNHYGANGIVGEVPIACDH